MNLPLCALSPTLKSYLADVITSMLTHAYPYKPQRKIKVPIGNHQADTPWPNVWFGDWKHKIECGHTWHRMSWLRTRWYYLTQNSKLQYNWKLGCFCYFKMVWGFFCRCMLWPSASFKPRVGFIIFYMVVGSGVRDQWFSLGWTFHWIMSLIYFLSCILLSVYQDTIMWYEIQYSIFQL